MAVREVTFDENYYRDPRAFYADLQLHGPIHRFTSPSGTSGWLIIGYEPAKTVLAHPQVGKSQESMTGARAPFARRTSAMSALGDKLKKDATSYLVSHMLGSDLPDHARLRRAASARFTPDAVAAMEPRITDITDQLIAKFDTGGPTDLVTGFAFPLPVQVISDILGIPARHQDRIGRSSQILSDVIVAEPWKLRAAALDFAALILPYLQLRSLCPRDDMLSDMAAQRRGGALNTKEALSTAALLLIAGHETTSSLIVNSLLALFANPNEIQKLHQNPGRIDSVVEESLRFDPPLPTTTLREARGEFVIEGQRVRQGDYLMVSLIAANHDPAAVAAGDVFNPDRNPQRHMGFGHGIHYCLGAHLAGLEARTALTRLLAAYPRITPAFDASELRWRQSIVFRRVESLPVILSPQGLPNRESQSLDE